MIIELEYTPDIFSKNDVFYMEGLQGAEPISALMAVVVGESPFLSTLLSLNYIFEKVGKDIIGAEIFGLIANDAMQPDNRIVRYQGISGLLKITGINVDKNEIIESIHTYSDGIKFHGAIDLSENSPELISRIMQMKSTYISTKIGIDEINKIIEMEWSGNIGLDIDFIRSVCEFGGILFKRFGDFDDRDRGVIMFCSRRLMNDFIADGIKAVRP